MDQASPRAAGIQVEKLGTPQPYLHVFPVPFQGIVGKQGGAQGYPLSSTHRMLVLRLGVPVVLAREERAALGGRQAGAAQALHSCSCSEGVFSKAAPCGLLRAALVCSLLAF